MFSSSRAFIVSALLAFGYVSTASALPMSFLPKHFHLPQAAEPLLEARSDMTPYGYVKFCLTYGDECKPVTGSQRIALDEANWTLLNQVNAEVNARIAPDPEKGFYDWSLTTTYGNCNDYAVQKRKELIGHGIPASALSLSVVITPWGEGHLILTARTDRGDFVLDSLRSRIVAWNHAGYQWVRVQSGADPNQWVRVEPEAHALRFVRTAALEEMREGGQSGNPAASLAATAANPRNDHFLGLDN